MSYIARTITTEEKLLSLLRPHWIYLFEGAFWFVLLVILGFAADYFLYVKAGIHAVTFRADLGFISFNERFTPIPWVFSLTGFVVFWSFFLIYVSNEIGLTDQRIIHKKGLLFIEIDQVDLEDIRGEHVVHGWLGWLLGYGKIRLDCRFIHDVWLPAVRNPYKLVKASHIARLKHPHVEYGEDEFQSNIERIEEQKLASKRIRRVKEVVKNNFRRAA